LASLTNTKTKLSALKILLLLLTSSFSTGIFAAKEPSKIDYVKSDNITNQIPYFDNRFRLDAQLNKITLLFYRKSGSVPVILIRPDGSKLRINNYPKDKVEWFDDVTFDMIKIKKPMPGPWQVIGDILSDSQILVVSEVKIAVAPLPKILLAGETLKVEGKLMNGDVAFDNPRFRNVVQLDVEFISTNNAAFENFGSDLVELTSFRDDGRELDEYAGDGIFTGEFQLTMAAGEWIPLYRIKLPMITRELRQQPIILHKNPISISVDITKDAKKFHKVHFIIDPKYVDPNSFIFQGKITYPDRQDEPFSITEGEGTERIKKFGYTEPGVHRINVSAFGRTLNGREFRLVVPEFTFNVDLNNEELLAHISAINSDVDIDANAENTTTESVSDDIAFVAKQEHEAQQAAKKEQEKQMQWLIIGAGNLVILILGLGGFFFIRRRNKK